MAVVNLLDRELTDTKVAGYVAKYVTKAAECSGTLDRRITAADRLAELPAGPSSRRRGPSGRCASDRRVGAEPNVCRPAEICPTNR
jgi:hypothetical protein